MALRLWGSKTQTSFVLSRTHLNYKLPFGNVHIRSYKVAKPEGKDGKDGKEGKTEEVVKPKDGKEEKKEKEIKKHTIPFPVDISGHFRSLPTTIVLGLDTTGRTNVGYTFLDQRGNLLSAGSIDTKV